MEQNRFSDLDPTMVAKRTFENIIEHIQTSNLNFQLNLSPFSASISLRKSLIRDKFGNILFPAISSGFATSNVSTQDLEHQHSLLLDQIATLEEEVNGLKLSRQSSQDTVQILEQKISHSEASAYKCFEERKNEVAALKKSVKSAELENDNLKKDLKSYNKLIKERDKEVYKLEQKCENLTETLKRSKAEITSLKSENVKLVKKKKISPSKIQQSVSTNTTSEEPASIPYSNTSLSTNFALDSMETSQVTSTSANPVSAASALCVSATDLLNNVVPIIQSQDSSASSASSSSTSQPCVTVARQPLPPPPEKCSILCHTGSKYNEHMASETGVPSRYGTHEYCMRIEYENYGCEDCIWFKKWGLLHGYPDISPRSYREHLQPLTNL